MLGVTGKKTNRLHEVLHNEAPHVSSEHAGRKKPKRSGLKLRQKFVSL